jgi:hypothetical protein
MHIPAVFDPLLTWPIEQFPGLVNISPAFILLGGLIPLSIGLMTRNLLATLVTVLLTVGAIAVGTTFESNWTPLGILGATSAFSLVLAAIVRGRRRRASPTVKLHDSSIHEELREIKARLNVLELCERRRRNLIDTAGIPAPLENVHDSRTKFPVAQIDLNRMAVSTDS